MIKNNSQMHTTGYNTLLLFWKEWMKNENIGF